MRKQLHIFVTAILLLLLSACDPPVQQEDKAKQDDMSGPLVEVNRYMLERHRDRIVAFVKRADWEMTESPTGLWYEILEKGEGRATREGYLVSYTYTTRLLDGTFCYAADTNSPKKIVLGKGRIESGLDEGLRLLRVGDRARFIIPPHLAHGNFGDGDRIPGSAILLVEVGVLDVRR